MSRVSGAIDYTYDTVNEQWCELTLQVRKVHLLSYKVQQVHMHSNKVHKILVHSYKVHDLNKYMYINYHDSNYTIPFSMKYGVRF